MRTYGPKSSLMAQTTITTFFQQIENTTSSEEVDDILDQYHPGWRDVVYPHDIDLQMSMEWAALLFQAAYRRYVARINYPTI